MSGISGLYAITPDLDDTRELARRVELAILGGASCIQYRNKSASSALRAAQGRALEALCRAHAVPLVVNDDAALAAELAAQGVHLGAADGSLSEAKLSLGPGKIVGVSCYDSLSKALAAEAAGAGYVAFGSFFPSPSKAGTVRAPLELLVQARERLRIPIVAIGGIHAGNAPSVIRAGADAIAVISAVFSASDVRAAARELSELFH